jgi:hypothetical protein
VLIGVPLIYVAYVAGAVAQYSHGAGAVAGYAIIAAFCGSFVALAVLESRSPTSPPRFWGSTPSSPSCSALRCPSPGPRPSCWTCTWPFWP